MNVAMIQWAFEEARKEDLCSELIKKDIISITDAKLIMEEHNWTNVSVEFIISKRCNVSAKTILDIKYKKRRITMTDCNDDKIKSFLICPVRGISEDTWEQHVSELEAQGFDVHFPPRDTDQDDITGYRICKDNMEAIKNADVVHFIWDGKSQGCLFDLGMAFALNKRIVALQMPALTFGKSFQNMVTEWEENN